MCARTSVIHVLSIACFGAGVSEEKQRMFTEVKLQMTYRRDDDDPAYWLYIISTPDGHVVKTTRFRLGEVFESTSVAGRPITVTSSATLFYQSAQHS